MIHLDREKKSLEILFLLDREEQKFHHSANVGISGDTLFKIISSVKF